MTRAQAAWLKFALFAVFVVFPVTLFAIQNWSRTALVSFDWGLGKVQTPQPWPVPGLLGVAFIVGVFVGLSAWWRERWNSRKRIGELESKLVRANAEAAKGQPKAAAPAAARAPEQEWA